MRGPERDAFRVLVVDDNVDTAQSLTLLLETWGYAVAVAHDGPSGLAAAREFRPHAVLLDIGLPALDGFEVARALRALPDAEPPLIVASSGYNRDSDLRRATEVGIDLYLVKPFDPFRLEDILADYRRSAETRIA